jgi:hypothetical protein
VSRIHSWALILSLFLLPPLPFPLPTSSFSSNPTPGPTWPCFQTLDFHTCPLSWWLFSFCVYPLSFRSQGEREAWDSGFRQSLDLGIPRVGETFWLCR